MLPRPSGVGAGFLLTHELWTIDSSLSPLMHGCSGGPFVFKPVWLTMPVSTSTSRKHRLSEAGLSFSSRGTLLPSYLGGLSLRRGPLSPTCCAAQGYGLLPPPLDVSGCNAFLVLTDGLPRILQVDRSIIHNSEDFRQAASLALGCSIDTLSCKVSKPRITDCSHYGTPCQAVVVATTALCRVPIPPGRPTAPQVLVFFDLRTVLRGFTWQIFDNHLLCLESLEARFSEGAPVGYQVCVHGGEPELHQWSTFLRVSFGCMLWIEYAPCTDPDSAGHLEPSGGSSDDDSSSDSSDSSPEDGPADGPTDGPPADRSRTPRNRHPSHRGPRNLFQAHGAYASIMLLYGNLVGGPALARAGNSPRPALQDLRICCVDLPSSVSQWDLQTGGVQTKLLCEPTCSGPGAQPDLGALRRAASLLGGRWPGLRSDGTPLPRLQDYGADTDSTVEQTFWVTVLVLVPELPGGATCRCSFSGHCRRGDRCHVDCA